MTSVCLVWNALLRTRGCITRYEPNCLPVEWAALSVADRMFFGFFSGHFTLYLSIRFIWTFYTTWVTLLYIGIRDWLATLEEGGVAHKFCTLNFFVAISAHTLDTVNLMAEIDKVFSISDRSLTTIAIYTLHVHFVELLANNGIFTSQTGVDHEHWEKIELDKTNVMNRIFQQNCLSSVPR